MIRPRPCLLLARASLTSSSTNSLTTKVCCTIARLVVYVELLSPSGTAHGFAARPNFALPEIVAAYNGAFSHTVAWFAKTLPV